jgi:LacI family transcriptional regulator
VKNADYEAARSTLATVAQLAGVSVPTVSKVLNGHIHVSAATRQRVREAMKDCDYTPVGSRQETRTVEVVFDDLTSVYSAQVLGGIIDAGDEAGLTVVPRRFPDEAGPGWASRVRSHGRAGVLVVSAVLEPEQVERFDEAGVPLVVIDSINLPRKNLTSIGATNFNGGFAATEHLVQLGHRRIAHVAGPPQMACNVARLHGYRAALEQAGIDPHSNPVEHGLFTYETGFERARAWLASTERPTAIFAGCDLLALGVIEAARTLGLRVPDDLSIVGFDDSHLAEWSSPPLTTIHQPLRAMGALAMRTLARLAERETIESHHVELATHLVTRQSTARL